MDKPVVYDVGMNNGDDTQFYLRKGYRVVAIEAAPDLVEEGRRKFRRYVESGDLVIENVGIADREGHLDFFMCEGNSVWNSFDRDKASSAGQTATVTRTPCTTLDRVMSTHGVPLYCKIDIEGYDHHAVASLANIERPKYLSIEFGHKRAVDDITTLKELGYTGFKLIDQVHFGECTPDTLDRYSRLPERSLKRRLKAQRAVNKLCRNLNVALPFYASGSSGPFGDMLEGPWLEYKTTCELARQVVAFDEEKGWNGMGWWFDIHAVRPDAKDA